MGGMASLSGPVPTIWVQLRGWNKHEQRGVNQPFNMAVLATGARRPPPSRASSTARSWCGRPSPCPTTLIGARLGLSLYGRINDVQFRRIVLVLLGLSGATLIASSLR